MSKLNNPICIYCGYNLFMNSIYGHKCKMSRRILYSFVKSRFSILDILMFITIFLFNNLFYYWTFLMMYYATRLHIGYLIFKRDLR